MDSFPGEDFDRAEWIKGVKRARIHRLRKRCISGEVCRRLHCRMSSLDYRRTGARTVT